LKRSTKAVKEITKRSCEAAKKPREEGYDMDEKGDLMGFKEPNRTL
jgi:hypothetical protein